MAKRFAYLYYETGYYVEFEEWVREFQRQGISLQNPMSKLITALSEVGEQISVSKDWLAQAQQIGNTFSFQWWLDSATDVYTRLRFLDDVVVEEYGLEGLGEQLHPIGNILKDRFINQLENNRVMGFVIDKYGITEDFDWDQFFIHGKRFAGQFPDILCIHPNGEPRIPAVPNATQISTTCDHLILSIE